MFFFNGQRETAGYLRVDGLGANLGLLSDASNVPFSTGATPARTANGAANAVISAFAVREAGFLAWQYGNANPRTPGRQVSLATAQSGDFGWRGAVFSSFDGTLLRANDWFANNRGRPRPTANIHNFGGTLGKSLSGNDFHILATYEGLRGRIPGFSLVDTPSRAARNNAPLLLRPLLDAFPLPNGAARSDGLAEFAGAYGNEVRHDYADLKFDRIPVSQYLWARYSYSGSRSQRRGAAGFAPNARQTLDNRTQTLSGGASLDSSNTALDIRAGYSRVRVGQSFSLDDFGGAQTASLTNLTGAGRFVRYELLGRDTALAFGPARENLLEQINLNGNLARDFGNHHWNWGADYRRLRLGLEPQNSETGLLVAGWLNAPATATRAQFFSRQAGLKPHLGNFAAYTHYGWHTNQVTNITAGLLWELGPPPRVAGQTAPLWRTDYRNFAPRLGVAWSFPRGNYKTTIRAGLGWFYEMSNTGAAQVFGQSFPFFEGRVASGLPLVTLTPNLSGPPNYQVLLAFAPKLRTPYSRQFSLSLRHSLTNDIELTAGFHDTQGRRLWLTRTQSDFDPRFALARVTDNGAVSSFRAFNLRFQTVRRKGFDALLNYSFSQARDNYTPDTLAQGYAVSANPAQDFGPADFDARHSLRGFAVYSLANDYENDWASRLLRRWQISTLFHWRGATPLNVVYGRLNGFGLTYSRPDLLSGVAVFATNAGPLRQLNAAAFALPAGADNGNLRRNSLRGYGFAQLDLALSRSFSLTQETSLTFRAEAANLLNHANFVAPSGFDASLGTVAPDGSFTPNTAFGQTRATAGQDTSAGANFLAPYQSGGARSARLAISFKF